MLYGTGIMHQLTVRPHEQHQLAREWAPGNKHYGEQGAVFSDSSGLAVRSPRVHHETIS